MKKLEKKASRLSAVGQASGGLRIAAETCVHVRSAGTARPGAAGAKVKGPIDWTGSIGSSIRCIVIEDLSLFNSDVADIFTTIYMPEYGRLACLPIVNMKLGIGSSAGSGNRSLGGTKRRQAHRILEDETCSHTSTPNEFSIMSLGLWQPPRKKIPVTL